jgi:N-acetyl-anhydromuramyl-L-alanine amidase AmpD
MVKLKINNQTYKLSSKNYIKTPHSKQQIVLANSFSMNMNHFNGWLTRHGGQYKRTAPFTIDIYGNVHQHYSPEYYSYFFSVGGLDEHVIPILIENEGWLEKDVNTGEYINYVGNIYNRNESVVEKSWRGHQYWAPYTKDQLEAAIKLSKYLCGEFKIPREAISHNTKFDGIYEFNGVIYKSNYNKHYSDLSPAWDYVNFKNELEKN